jgi:dTDP-4-dehydrorhamnose 3,5-epimerase-like enzyme
MAIKVKHTKPEFIDERGFISRIIDQDAHAIRAVLYIQRKKGSRGADHFHKKDAHYIYVLSGKVKYGEIDTRKKNATTQYVTLLPGDVVLSSPMIAHTTEFLEDTVILAFTTENREHKDYEKDTVRVDTFIKDTANK